MSTKRTGSTKQVTGSANFGLLSPRPACHKFLIAHGTGNGSLHDSFRIGSDACAIEEHRQAASSHHLRQQHIELRYKLLLENVHDVFFRHQHGIKTLRVERLTGLCHHPISLRATAVGHERQLLAIHHFHVSSSIYDCKDTNK